MINRRRVVFWPVLIICIMISVCYSLLTPPVFQATSKVIFSKEAKKDVWAQISLIKDTAVLGEVVKELDIRDSAGILLSTSDISKRIKTVRVKDTGVVEIKAESRDPAEASNIANSAARQFIKWENKLDSAELAAYDSYLSAQTEKLRKYQKYIDQKMSRFSKTIASSFSGDRKEAIMKHADLEIEKARINMLLTRARLSRASNIADDGSGDLKKRMLTLDDAVSGYVSKRDALAQDLKVLYNIAKDSRILNALYPMYYQKSTEIRMLQAVKGAEIEIVSQAVPPKDPVSPKRAYSILAGVLVSLMLSCGSVFLVEYFDQNIKTVEEARQVFGPALIAAVPNIRVNTLEFSALPDRRSDVSKLAAAALEPVYKAMDLMAFSRGVKTVVFESAVKDLSCPLILASVALRAAEDGKKVLIIDTENREPVQHKIFGVKDQPGLSEYLLGEEKDLSSAVKGTKVKNLSVLPAGRTVTEPAGPDISRKAAEIIAALSGKYDLILAGSEPIFEKDRIAEFGTASDSTVFIFSEGDLSGSSAAAAVEMIKKKSKHYMGAIYSQIKFSGPKYPLTGAVS